jgi:hypothetical protein
MFRPTTRRRYGFAAYLAYACAVLTLGNAGPAWAVNDRECTGNSPGCINPAYCSSPSKTKPGYSCEEGFPIPHKYCVDAYGKDCEDVQVNCGRINYWSGGPCSGDRCDAIILREIDYLQTTGCLPPAGGGG